MVAPMLDSDEAMNHTDGYLNPALMIKGQPARSACALLDWSIFHPPR
jgi:hypothetical protein